MQITSTNAPTMLWDAMNVFKVNKNRVRMTRNGPAIELEGVTILHYLYPKERVLFSKLRDGNPFFHLMESIWILCGRRDVEFISYFLKNIAQYSDDGEVFNASYGYRMRSHFGMDQLKEIVTHLENNNRTRQAVIQLWDPNDINKNTKDRACNMSLVFSIPDGEVNLTVFNRSNDLFFGAVGANVVQFSQILEVVAIAMGLEVGEYYQVSNNMHLYTKLYPRVHQMLENPSLIKDNRYITENLELYPLNTGVPDMRSQEWIDIFTNCANMFCDDPFTQRKYVIPYFNDVVYPMAMAFKAYKESMNWKPWINKVEAADWRIAGLEWLQRRM